MSILIFSSDKSFGDFLYQSLHESGLQAHRAVSFSDAELKLYKSEPDIAIFVDLDDSELRKIGRAVGESCSVLVIGGTHQRNISKAHWRFLAIQSSVNAVLAEISDFFLDSNEVRFSLSQEQSSHSLEEHFSTSASSDPFQSNMFGSTLKINALLETQKVATYGLNSDEVAQLGSEFQMVSPIGTPFCDSVLVRPDDSQDFLDFLALTQSVLPTAFVSLGTSDFFQLLSCTVVRLDSDSSFVEIVGALHATKRENGPCYPAQLEDKDRLELDRLGCRMGNPFDFVSFGPKNQPLIEQVNMEQTYDKELSQNVTHLYSKSSDFEKRRNLWFVAARTRCLQNRRVQHLPDLIRGLKQFHSPYLLSISTERSDSRRFVSNMLRENVPLLVNSKNSLLCLCEADDLKHIKAELESLQRWTGRDTKGLGWFPCVKTRAFKVEPNTIALVLASMGELTGNDTPFEIIDDIRERVQQ